MVAGLINLIYLLPLPLLLIAFYRLGLARYIENQPDTSIAGAAQGMVEIKARTVLPDTLPLQVPVLGVPCVWFRIETSVFDEERKTVDARESYRRFYISDGTGVCAVDPLHAEVHPRRIREIRDGNVFHRITWIGVDDNIYILGWMHSLHPRPQTEDQLGEAVPAGTEPSAPIRRYGQLKEKLERITRPPFPGMPFLISTHYEHQLVERMRRRAKYWFAGFFAALLGIHGWLIYWQ